jgi:hypothetical protein
MTVFQERSSKLSQVPQRAVPFAVSRWLSIGFLVLQQAIPMHSQGARHCTWRSEPWTNHDVPTSASLEKPLNKHWFRLEEYAKQPLHTDADNLIHHRLL